MKITILDPAMCCSTGVCGTEVDDSLVETAANVKWLKSQGYEVSRHNISNDGHAFKQYPKAIAKIQAEGVDSLPFILLNDELVKWGNYPSKEEWMQLLEASGSATGLEPEISTPPNEILIGIGAAIAAGNENALKQYVFKAEKSGIDIQEISKAMNIGNSVKMILNEEVSQQANALLNKLQPASNTCSPGGGCC